MTCNIYRGIWITRLLLAIREDGRVFKYDHATLRWLEVTRKAADIKRLCELVAKNVQFKQP